MNDKVESTTLLCFYQNEILKAMKASLGAISGTCLILPPPLMAMYFPKI